MLAALYDIALLYKHHLLSRVLYLGFFVTALPFPFLFYTYQSPFSTPFKIVLIFGMGASLLLLIYSVLVEIPLKGHADGTLYTKGTYAFCRHPGFWWYTIFTLCVIVYFWYAPIVLVGFGFIACNFLLIVFEDVILFPRLFPQYGEYKKTTPFLIPC